MQSSISASDLYAISQCQENRGDNKCHWCGAKCTREYLHDDLLNIPFVKNKNLALHPSEPFICKGCWLFRRQSLTVHFLDPKTRKDRQAPTKLSWLITRTDAKGIQFEDYQLLYPILLKPPHSFVLSLITSPSIPNHIHRAVANDYVEVKLNTVLKFTIDNVIHQYTIDELTNGIRSGVDGREPGVRTLIKLLGPYDLKEPAKEKPGSGRVYPPGGQVLENVIAKSGA